VPWLLAIPILLFVALIAVFAVLLRRIGVLIAEQRETTAFRRSVEDLAARIDGTLATAIAQIDAVRRQQKDAETINDSLDATMDALSGFGDEARALKGPPVIEPSRAAFVDEIDRADRALEMVEHGLAILSTGNATRLSEGQTAIKRGGLNVVHAREAIARHASDIAATRSAEEVHWLSRRRRTGPS
jgi:hypothetical protein